MGLSSCTHTLQAAQGKGVGERAGAGGQAAGHRAASPEAAAAAGLAAAGKGTHAWPSTRLRVRRQFSCQSSSSTSSRSCRARAGGQAGQARAHLQVAKSSSLLRLHGDGSGKLLLQQVLLHRETMNTLARARTSSRTCALTNEAARFRCARSSSLERAICCATWFCSAFTCCMFAAMLSRIICAGDLGGGAAGAP